MAMKAGVVSERERQRIARVCSLGRRVRSNCLQVSPGLDPHSVAIWVLILGQMELTIRSPFLNVSLGKPLPPRSKTDRQSRREA